MKIFLLTGNLKMLDMRTAKKKYDMYLKKTTKTNDFINRHGVS